MPNVECYRDIGAIGARLDEIEKSRIERETANEWARLEREAHVDETLAELSAKMDALNADRQTLIGILWAVRILFGGVFASALYLLSNGVPAWLKRALQ